MANKTIYPYGIGGQLPSGIAVVNDLTTGGADKALSAEMGKTLDGKIGDIATETKNYTRYVHPVIFGNYMINESSLGVHNGYWCTQPVLVHPGETISSAHATKYLYMALVAAENLPLTASTPVTRVVDTGNVSNYAVYTNDTNTDVYVIFAYSRGQFYELPVTGRSCETVALKEDIANVKSVLSQPKRESISVSFFKKAQLNVALQGGNVGKLYEVANTGFNYTQPINLKAGDALHVIVDNDSGFGFGQIEDGEEQTSSTYYTGLGGVYDVGYTTHRIFRAQTDIRVIFCCKVGSLQEVYIERPSSELLTQQMIYPTIADECVVENGDSDVCLIMGSSLTYSSYSPKSMSWIERVNDLVDIGIVNGGHSGANLSGNITDMTTGTINLLGISLKSLRPRYIISNNDANGTPTGKDLDTQLKLFERIAKSVGATCLVCGEEPTLINAANYHKQAAMTKGGVNYYPSAILWRNLNRTQSYTGWMDGSQHVHSNAKNGSSHVSMTEMLSQLYIHKSVKFYKVRENYKAGSPTTAQLAYTSNTERAAIWRGTCPAIGNGTSPWANDNIDGTGYIDGETPGVDKMTDTNITSEVAIAKGGGTVTFYKHALVEIITPRVQVTQAQVSIECSAEPTAVGYISNGSYVALTPTYADGVITIALNSADIQDYDKIKIVVSDTTDETFTLGKVKAVLLDGESKPSYEVRYKGRKVGAELMNKTSVESGWTMTGNATVEQLPTAVRNYTSLNDVANHIQLDDDSASASYTQSLDKVVHKVAVRIAACIFPPIQTLRTSNDYTTTVQNLFRGMYYGGDLLLTINGAYTPLHIEFGWTEVYAEAVIDSNSLSISLGRATAFDPDNYNVGEFPVFIHNVSVQEI